ncbi:MAG: SH3 domain-containing protein [Anaerolineaceae bacterium]|nr:SH3 domain-containing protein [Anaerolineaceae bacterium]
MPDSNPQRLPDQESETRPTPPPTLPELPDAEVTRAQQPIDRTRAVRVAELLPDTPEKPKRGRPQVAPPQRKRQERRENPLALPLWSVLLMLLGVAGTVVGIVGLVLLLGGASPLEQPPRIVVLTADLRADTGSANPSLLATPSIPAEFNSTPSAPLALIGPTLAPVAITPTVENITIGKTVRVGAQETGLNIRSDPGTIGTTVLFVAPSGQSFTVIDGPLQADGLVWWKVQNPLDSTQTGWGAAAFLEIVPGS